MLSGATQERRREISPDAETDLPLREAFSPERVARLFQPWENARKILLAVSGGPDSVALMLLAEIVDARPRRSAAPACRDR